MLPKAVRGTEAFIRSLKSPIANVRGLITLQGPVIGLVLLFVFLCLSTPSFLSVSNYLNVIDQITINGIMAIGMTLVIIIGGIDLSVASLLVLSMMVFGVLTRDLAVPYWLAILAGILSAALCGIINGVLVVKARVPAFIATMAMMNIARGIANLISGNTQRYGFDAWFGNLSTMRYMGFLSVTTVLFLALTIGFGIFITYRGTGRRLFAIGGNKEVARMAGVRVSTLSIGVFGISGTLAGLAGVVLNSRLLSSQPYGAQGYELNVIAAVVIGGASLNGGAGSIVGTFIGTLIIGILRNGLNLHGMNTFFQDIVIGAVIALTVAIDMSKRRKLTIAIKAEPNDPKRADAFPAGDDHAQR
jgi:ribose transport system permease protein